MTDTTTQTPENGDDTTGLKNKNAELNGKLVEAKRKADDLEKRLADLEAERDDALDTSKSDVDKLKSAHKRDIDKLNNTIKARDEALEALTAQVSTFTIDNVISKAITDAGVAPGFVDMVQTYLRSGVAMKDGEAMAGDTPLADRISTYFASDAAKLVIAAPMNSGGGALGNRTANGSTRGFTKETFTLTERSKIEIAEGAEVANSIAKSLGIE